MKIIFRYVIVLFFLLFQLSSIFGNDTIKNKIQLGLGLSFVYTQVDIILSMDNIENTMTYYYPFTEISIHLFDSFSFGFLVGYSCYSFADPVDFYNLPLSLRFENKTRNSMLIGLPISMCLATDKYLAFILRGKWIYYKADGEDISIELPIVSGTSLISNSFNNFTINLLIEYNPFKHMAISLGPELNFLNGKFKIHQIIENIEAEKESTYTVKNIFGLGGEIKLLLTKQLGCLVGFRLFSENASNISIYYIF